MNSASSWDWGPLTPAASCHDLLYFTNLAVWGSEICGPFNTVTTSLQYSSFHFRLWGQATETGSSSSSSQGEAEQAGARSFRLRLSVPLSLGPRLLSVRTHWILFSVTWHLASGTARHKGEWVYMCCHCPQKHTEERKDDRKLPGLC